MIKNSSRDFYLKYYAFKVQNVSNSKRSRNWALVLRNVFVPIVNFSEYINSIELFATPKLLFFLYI